MSIDIRVNRYGDSSLITRYLGGDPEVLSFFAGNPFETENFQHRWTTLLQGQTRSTRAAAAAALHPTSERARQRLDRFVSEGGAVVTTGQQAGLFTGPLYTIYKALTAVKLAEGLEKLLGVVVLPVFWTASEDHDWAEVDHAHILDGRDRLRRIVISSTDSRPLPIHERVLGADLESALDEISDVFAGQPYAEYVEQVARTAYRPGRSMAAAFRDLLSNLLAPFDVLMTDAADPQLKQASIPVLRHELESAAAHEKLLHLTSDRLVQSGITPQVPILPSASNLFLRTDQGRERLLQSQRGWITRDSGEHYSLDELKQILAAEPARFSPNVLLRPVVESHVFPVLAYVAGPAECSYFAQLGELFGAHGLAMPLVYPRASLTLVEAHMQKRLERIGLTADDLQTPRHLLVHRHSRASVPTAVQDALRALRTVVVAHFDALAETVAEHDHSLDIPLGTLRNRALLVIGDAESKIVRAVAGGQKQWQGDLDSILDYLLPLGSGQERVVNVLPFLARHGPSLLRAVYETIPVHFEVPR